MRYLEEKYGDVDKATAKYSALMQILNEMGPIVDIIRDVYANDIGKTEIAHVLAEIYDLV